MTRKSNSLALLEHNATLLSAVTTDVARELPHDSSANNIGLATFWNEAVACILSSAVPYEVVLAAVAELKRSNLFHLQSVLKLQRHARLASALRQVGYRFPTARSKQLLRAAKVVSRHRRVLQAHLDSREPRAFRKFIVEEVPGLGPKQASMLLRNLGVGLDLAILDTHVIRFMAQTELLPGDPSSVSVSHLVSYEYVEQVFLDFARQEAVSPAVLDRVVWFMMRSRRAGVGS